jgi:UDP-GlcNAc:undecaprenyl-phosphate/decaprenyl-phosphate GlcNAc-1-phosphate transferase
LTIFYLAIFVASLLLSFVLTRYVRDLSSARGWVAPPVLDRHLHRVPVPRSGGVAVFLAFLLSFAFALLARRYYLGLAFGVSIKTVATILLPGLLIFLLGVYDDVHPVGPYAKFSVQAAAGAMLFAGGLRCNWKSTIFRILNIPLLSGNHHFPWFVGLPLTILWVLAITNAFNLIDGLDGLAAGSALFSTVVVFVVALVSHSVLVSLMSLALAGAILGFLRFNFNPATIFLGDCGSLFIGFILSALALQGAEKAPTIIAVAIPVVSFGLPILDTALCIVRRLISGRPVFIGDREHIHHKLLERGLSHRQVVITLYAVSAMFALLSLFLLWPTGKTLGWVLAVVGAGIWVGIQHLGYLEFGELRRVAQRTIEPRQMLINNLAIRRAVEELKVTRDYGQLCPILEAALGASDFDAFDLYLYRPGAEFCRASGLKLISHSREDSLLRWRKPGSDFGYELATAWSLKLDLVTSRNRRWGSMTIYRMYTERDLQLDINLLTSVLPVALADALERTLIGEIAVMPRLEQPSGWVAAHAG